jgi:hypothetical protein
VVDGDLPTSSVKLEMNYDLWQALQNAPDPVTALRERVLYELQVDGYGQNEIDVIAADPVFIESVQEQYLRVEKSEKNWDRRPSKLKFEFAAPGTEKKGWFGREQ